MRCCTGMIACFDLYHLLPCWKIHTFRREFVAVERRLESLRLMKRLNRVFIGNESQERKRGWLRCLMKVELDFRMTAVAHDEAARFVFSLTNGSRGYAQFADFAPLILDIVETHPSLDFLKADSRFHQAYVETVR